MFIYALSVILSGMPIPRFSRREPFEAASEQKSQNNIALYKKEDSFLMYMEFGVRNPQFVDSYRMVNHPGSFCFVVSPSLTVCFHLKGYNDCSHPAITADSNHQKEGKGEV